MITIGTAGHVDHGKSSLIEALTTINPDRLPEEKARGMTVDLGFAWMDLPCGSTIGFVDVPGHKQFIHNVIPGFAGIDAALLVVAADDGWMPQTEEHVHILGLLGIEHVIVALSKTDLVSSSKQLETIKSNLWQRLSGTHLKNSPIIPVCAHSGEGLPDLKKAIECLAQTLPPKQSINKPRLPIDRVFVIKGIGVVVTGTPSYGNFQSGDKVTVVPSGLSSHIRSMECYKKNTSTSTSGMRLAMNLTGIKVAEISRGDIVVSAGQSIPESQIIDIWITILPKAESSLKTMSEMSFFLETRSLLGRIKLIGRKELFPGESSPAQVSFQQNVSTFIGERFIIRKQSPSVTIGGGVVLDPQAKKMRPSEELSRIAFLQQRLSLNLHDIILAEISKSVFQRIDALDNLPFSSTDITACLGNMEKQGEIIITSEYCVFPSTWDNLKHTILSETERKMHINPLIPIATVLGALDAPNDVSHALIQQMTSFGILVRYNDMLSLPGKTTAFTQQQQQTQEMILSLFAQSPASPPTLKAVTDKIPHGTQVLHFMLKQGLLINLGDGVLLEASQFDDHLGKIVAHLKQNGSISIQDIHQLCSFSRKYSVPLLSYLDRLGYTVRDGNVRKPGKKLSQV